VAVAVSDSRESIPVPPPVTAVEAAALEASDVFARLGSGTEGLAEGEAARPLRVVGPNAVRSYRARWWPVLLSQLRSPLLLLFTPGARTNWHSHAVGQTLHVTDGIGLVQTRDGKTIRMRPGDTVYTPPGEEHWHGATAGNFMCHLAMLEGVPGATGPLGSNRSPTSSTRPPPSNSLGNSTSSDSAPAHFGHPYNSKAARHEQASGSRRGARHLPAHLRGRPGELCWPAEHDLPESSQYGNSSHP